MLIKYDLESDRKQKFINIIIVNFLYVVTPKDNEKHFRLSAWLHVYLLVLAL